MLVLGIETSCDETALALLRFSDNSRPNILYEIISSQTEIHKQYGGVVPELASREHLKNLPMLLESTLKESKISLCEIDLVAVTRGPGLKGCLLMGTSFAQGLSEGISKPLIGVNHIEGHLLAPHLDNPELDFPYLCLIVSGGHTEIHAVRAVGNYELITRTQDDAAGEAFDKSANLLGLEYPGGAQLAALADSVSSAPYKLPRVMQGQDAFSFSGLKTAFSLLVKKNVTELDKPNVKAELAHAMQEAIVTTLIDKVKSAIKTTGLKNIAVSGGVAANLNLRSTFSNLKNVAAFFPKPLHSTDNAAMIAYVAGLRFNLNDKTSLQQPVLPRWPVESCRL